MSDYHSLDPSKFEDDFGNLHRMLPSSVIASVPAAKAAAKRYGRQVDFDFLNDRQVHWMLFQRREEIAIGSIQGCLMAIPYSIFTLGAFIFWGGVARYESPQFQLAFVVVETLALGVLFYATWRISRSAIRDRVTRNVRCRARLYRKIVIIARRGGADIPLGYPYYGMYAAARKYFPDAPDRPIPER